MGIPQSLQAPVPVCSHFYRERCLPWHQIKIFLAANLCLLSPGAFQAAPLRTAWLHLLSSPTQVVENQLIPVLRCAPPGLFTPSLYLSLIHYILSKEFRGQLLRLLMCVSSPPCSPPAINHLQVTIIDGTRAITPHSAIPGDKSNRAFGWPQKYFLPA